MQKTSLNNGAPFPDYVSPISETNSSKDDAFYSSILVDPNSQNPLENYESMVNLLVPIAQHTLANY